MKKILSITALVLVMALLLCACGEGKYMDSVMDTSGDAGKLSIRCFDPNIKKTYSQCFFIVFPDGSNMLVDSGYEDYSERIIGYLQQLGVTKIDRIVYEYAFKSSIGAMPDIVEAFDVGTIYFSKSIYQTDILTELQSILTTKNVEQVEVKAGDKIEISDDCYFDILFPNDDVYDYIDSQLALLKNSKDIDLNDVGSYAAASSIVMMLHYNDFSMLFTGDIMASQEMKLINAYDAADLQCDVLVVPYHGFNTSSCTKFRKTFDKIQYAIIAFNSIANQSVMTGWQEKGTVLHTKKVGSILLRSDGTDNIEVVTSKGLD